VVASWVGSWPPAAVSGHEIPPAALTIYRIDGCGPDEPHPGRLHVVAVLFGQFLEVVRRGAAGTEALAGLHELDGFELGTQLPPIGSLLVVLAVERVETQLGQNVVPGLRELGVHLVGDDADLAGRRVFLVIEDERRTLGLRAVGRDIPLVLETGIRCLSLWRDVQISITQAAILADGAFTFELGVAQFLNGLLDLLQGIGVLDDELATEPGFAFADGFGGDERVAESEAGGNHDFFIHRI